MMQGRIGPGRARRATEPGGAGLRHVGAGILADLQALLGGAQLRPQSGDILLPQAKNVAVPDDVHIGAGGIEQNLLLDGEEGLPPGVDDSLGTRRAAHSAKAAKDRLGQGDGGAKRLPVVALAAVRIDPGDPGIGLGSDDGAPAREGLRHRLVSGALAGAFGAQGGIAGIGEGEGLGNRHRFGATQRLRGNGSGRQHEERCCEISPL
jgi:hypothetical protein